MTDCATMGISGTTANAGLGIAALALTVAGALAGLTQAGAALRLRRVRGARARGAARAAAEARAARRARPAPRRRPLRCAA
jgi:hypothetical protein